MLDRPGHDALNRRRRDRRSSTGKRVTSQPRDLIWFQKLHQHGPLTSTFLHAFTESMRRSPKRARDRLTDLYNEDNTPHGGPYLERPWQQFGTFDARYQDLVYDLTPASTKALKDSGLWSDHGPAHAGPWVHRHMVAAITASIELATLGNPALTYIPQEAVLDRADTTLRYAVPFIHPRTAKKITKHLIPDAIFGLEYRTGNNRTRRYFVVEADRATEPSRSSRFNRKSHLRTLLQYREYVGRGLYKEHLKITDGLLVLNVTTSERTMAAMMKLVAEISPRGNSYLLFRTVDEFGRYFKPPKPMPGLLTEPWQRAGAVENALDQIVSKARIWASRSHRSCDRLTF